MEAILNGKLATLQSLGPRLDSLVTVDPVLIEIKSILNTVITQLIEVKTDLVISSTAQHESFIRTAKTEQYSRRNTCVVVGLKVDASESSNTHSKLADNVCKTLSSVSGTTVKPTDLSAVHRNGSGKSRSQPGARNTRSNTTPPSITVCFYNSNLKDKIMQNYSNFDSSANKPRDVRLYQSLTKYYSDLKTKISGEVESKLGKNKVRWIHWRSQSAGLVVKLKDSNQTVIKSIFCIDDFKSQFQSLGLS